MERKGDFGRAKVEIENYAPGAQPQHAKSQTPATPVSEISPVAKLSGHHFIIMTRSITYRDAEGHSLLWSGMMST